MPPKRPTKTGKILQKLKDHESQNVTFMAPDGSWPIVWEKAKGMHVWDLEGRKYLDLTAAFGVAACGHASREVTKAGTQQMRTLMHAMGDVHPHTGKANLARELSRWTFERWSRTSAKVSKKNIHAKTIFCNSGFEAVESALKTAHLATGKQGVIAFESGYHGLGYGALSVTHRIHFRGGFLSQLKQFGQFVPFPTNESEASESIKAIESILKKKSTGAIILEPIQSRGGLRIPPAGFLKQLRILCDQHETCLILDEIYTGFGRTGKWFACEHDPVIPDLICVGKALTGGFPMSACIGRSDLMDKAWPPSEGEAIHTSTYLGHPVGCAMALAQLKQLKSNKLTQAAQQKGTSWLRVLKQTFEPWKERVIPRGRGLMLGLELRDEHGKPDGRTVIRWTNELLQNGVIVLPEGDHGEVLGISPPLIISEKEMNQATHKLVKTFRKVIQS
jgi:4-aminobutyrate aminotransferase-like enzyme